MRTFVERRNAVRVETPFGTVTNFPLEGRVPTNVIETDAPFLDHIMVKLPRPIPALEERRVIVEEPWDVCGCPCCGRQVADVFETDTCECEESNLEDVILDLAEQIKEKQRIERMRHSWRRW